MTEDQPTKLDRMSDDLLRHLAYEAERAGRLSLAGARRLISETRRARAVEFAGDPQHAKKLHEIWCALGYGKDSLGIDIMPAIRKLIEDSALLDWADAEGHHDIRFNSLREELNAERNGIEPSARAVEARDEELTKLRADRDRLQREFTSLAERIESGAYWQQQAKVITNTATVYVDELNKRRALESKVVELVECISDHEKNNAETNARVLEARKTAGKAYGELDAALAKIDRR